MLKVFSGENRVQANAAIKQFLGPGYEVIEGADLSPRDLPSIFMGGSLFSSKRSILIRDILANRSVSDELPKYLSTPHDIAILELKVDKRSTAYKALKGEVEFKEFTLPKDPHAGLVFDIYRTAKRDGQAAVRLLEQIQPGQDPIMFLGLMASQAIKDYQSRPGIKEKRALRELSQLDLDLKSSTLQPWLLVQSFLLRLASL